VSRLRFPLVSSPRRSYRLFSYLFQVVGVQLLDSSPALQALVECVLGASTRPVVHANVNELCVLVRHTLSALAMCTSGALTGDAGGADGIARPAHLANVPRVAFRRQSALVLHAALVGWLPQLVQRVLAEWEHVARAQQQALAAGAASAAGKVDMATLSREHLARQLSRAAARLARALALGQCDAIAGTVSLSAGGAPSTPGKAASAGGDATAAAGAAAAAAAGSTTPLDVLLSQGDARSASALFETCAQLLVINDTATARAALQVLVGVARGRGVALAHTALWERPIAALLHALRLAHAEPLDKLAVEVLTELLTALALRSADAARHLVAALEQWVRANVPAAPHDALTQLAAASHAGALATDMKALRALVTRIVQATLQDNPARALAAQSAAGGGGRGADGQPRARVLPQPEQILQAMLRSADAAAASARGADVDIEAAVGAFFDSAETVRAALL
jgi:hypothetical protein